MNVCPPCEAASPNQFCRKMRHEQIKWSSSEPYTSRVKWNKFPKTHEPHACENPCSPTAWTHKRIIVIVINIVAVIFFPPPWCVCTAVYTLSWPQIAKRQMIYWSERRLQITCAIVSSPCHYCPMMSRAQKKSWKNPSRAPLAIWVHSHISYHGLQNLGEVAGYWLTDYMISWLTWMSRACAQACAFVFCFFFLCMAWCARYSSTK